MDDENSGRKVLIVDRWEDMQGRLVCLVLETYRHDETLLVIGGRNGLAAFAAEKPDAIIAYMNIKIPDIVGFCQQVDVPVIVWGAMDPRQVYPELQDAGAAGYLVQPTSAEEILAARDAILSGETYYPPLINYLEEE